MQFQLQNHRLRQIFYFHSYSRVALYKGQFLMETAAQKKMKRNVVLDNLLNNCATSVQDTSTQSIDCRSTSTDATSSLNPPLLKVDPDRQSETGSTFTSFISPSPWAVPERQYNTGSTFTSSFISPSPWAVPERQYNTDSFFVQKSSMPINRIPQQSCNWNRKNRLVLLEAYAKYKEELSLNHSIPGKMQVWSKIADDVRRRCFLNCDEEQCQSKVKQLRSCYYNRKRQGDAIENQSEFMEELKIAFENTNTPSGFKVPSSSSVEHFKWNKKAQILLLQTYAKYKREFMYTHEQKVWDKIIEEIEGQIFLYDSEPQCRIRIDELRCEYERIKDQFVKSRPLAIFLDEARRAFEPALNEGNLSAEQLKRLQTSGCKDFHLILLKVYSKYKALHPSADIEDKAMYKDIARELREQFSFDCGESMCQFSIFQLKLQYENIKPCVPMVKPPYFFEEAQKTFESDGILGNALTASTFSSSISSIPRAFPESQPETEKNFTIIVSNLSEHVQQAELRKLFHPFAVNRVYRIKDKISGVFKPFAFVRFNKEEDATRAIHAFDGAEYHNLILKVEWARPSKT